MARVSLSAFVVLLVLAVTPLAGTSQAPDKRATREREALRRVQQQLQQVQQEKAALVEKLAGADAQGTALAQEKEKLAAQVGGALARARSEAAKGLQLQSELTALTQEKQALSAERQTLQVQKAELEKRIADLAARQGTTERDLAQTQAQRTQAESALATRGQQVASCEDKNIKLYQHGRDLIAQCTDKSASAALLRIEPFTGIARVRLENLLEEYRDKLDAQKETGGELRR